MNTKVLKLMQLAMEISQAGKAEAFVSYSGHINGIHYRAHPAGQSYEDDAKMVHLVPNTNIYMNNAGYDQKLDAAIEQLEALAAEHKDEQV